MNHTFDRTLTIVRVSPKLSEIRLATIVVNIISIAASNAFFPQIANAEYAAFTWTKNLHATTQKSSERGQLKEPTGQPSSPVAAPTYDDKCVKTHKGVEPGAGAPTAINVELHSAFYNGGPGEHYTGCFDDMHLIRPGIYYQIGKDEHTGAPKSVIIAAAKCPTTLTWGDDTAAFLALLSQQITLCPDIQHQVGPGDVRFLSGPDGTRVFVRSSETAEYATLSPAETSAWVAAESRLSRWLWPVRRPGGLLLQDHTTAPVDLQIMDDGADAVLIQDGRSIHFSAGNSGWVDVRHFAEALR